MAQEIRFDGPIALVTGCVGACFSEMLSGRGGKVAVVDRQNLNDADFDVVGRIRDNGRDAIGLRNDIRDTASAEAIVDQAVEKYCRLHILINNAGTSGQTMNMTGEPDQRLEAPLDIHLRASNMIIRLAWTPMTRSNLEGTTAGDWMGRICCLNLLGRLLLISSTETAR